MASAEALSTNAAARSGLRCAESSSLCMERSIPCVRLRPGAFAGRAVSNARAMQVMYGGGGGNASRKRTEADAQFF
jgi:hypothetical protein